MHCLVLMFTLVIVEHVNGRPPLPPLPVKDGCFLVFPEVGVFRLEGEAVILDFPMFQRVLHVRKIAPRTAQYLITRDNGTEGVAYGGGGRVQQTDKQLWLLPAEASDSGEYTCTYRNDTYCVTGSIKLHVFKSSAEDEEKLSYPVSAAVGEQLRFRCPSLSNFNKTDGLIEWSKDSRHSGLQLGGGASFQPGGGASFQQAGGRLLIPAVRTSHAGVYTCLLSVLINDQPYKVSRVIVLRVKGGDPVPSPSPTPDLSVTSDPGLSSSCGTFPGSQRPAVVSPLNGSVFESLHGAELELLCKVLTKCNMADSTVVTWLLNGQSVEASYLDERATQGGRSVSRVTSESDCCQIQVGLVFVGVTEEDVKMELKCSAQSPGGRQEVVIQLQLEDSAFTWLLVAVMAACCFLTVVSVFLFVLLKPQRRNKADYFLARQNSTF